MARKPNTQNSNDSQALPSAMQAEQAYQAYTALQKLAARQPELQANEYFSALMDTANARFRSLFEAL